MLGLLEVSFVVIYGVVMPLIFAKQLVWLIRDSQRSKQLKGDGRLTDGQIVSRRKSVFTRGGSYFVNYSFKVEVGTSNEQTLTLEQEVSYKHYSQLRIGTPIQIIYAANSPNTAHITGDYTDGTGRLHAVYYALLVGVVWIGILVGLVRGF